MGSEHGRARLRRARHRGLTMPPLKRARLVRIGRIGCKKFGDASLVAWLTNRMIWGEPGPNSQGQSGNGHSSEKVRVWMWALQAFGSRTGRQEPDRCRTGQRALCQAAQGKDCTRGCAGPNRSGQAVETPDQAGQRRVRRRQSAQPAPGRAKHCVGPRCRARTGASARFASARQSNCAWTHPKIVIVWRIFGSRCLRAITGSCRKEHLSELLQRTQWNSFGAEVGFQWENAASSVNA